MSVGQTHGRSRFLSGETRTSGLIIGRICFGGNRTAGRDSRGRILSLKKKRSCIYLFMAALGLHGCKGVFSSCSELASHGGGSSCCRVDSRASGLGSCGAWSSLLRGMWDLHGPGIVGNRIAGDCRSIYAHTHTAHL